MNTHIFHRLVIFAVLTIPALPDLSAGINLVADGRAQVVIVVQEASKSIDRSSVTKSRKQRSGGFQCNDRTAAEVLSDWIEKISDVRLDITDRPHVGKPVIFIGTAAINAGLDLSDINSPTKEGLRIVSDGQSRLLIAGQNETSTVKAVCRFLEELGCRYCMDNVLGEVYPRSKTVTVDRLNITEKPKLMLRKIWGSQWTGQTLWKIWNGAGGISMSTGHAWGKYVNENLFETHPEYFALRDGQRRKGGWYCTSNPELRKLFAQGVISKGSFNPSVSPPDGTGYCQCEKCRA